MADNSTLKEPKQIQTTDKSLPVIQNINKTNEDGFKDTVESINALDTSIKNSVTKISNIVSNNINRIVVDSASNDNDIDDSSIDVLQINKSNNNLLSKLIKIGNDQLNFFKKIRGEDIKNKKIDDVQRKEIDEPERESFISIKEDKKKKDKGPSIFSKLFDKIKSIISPFIVFFSPLGKILGPLGKILSPLIKIGKFAFSIFKWVAVFEGLSSFINSLSKGEGLEQSIRNSVTSFMNLLLTPIYSLTDKIFGEGKTKEYIEIFINSFIDGIKYIGEKAGEFAAWVASGTAWDDIKKYVTDISVSIGNWISEKWESIKNWWNESNIRELFINVSTSIGNWISEKWESIKNWWNESEIKELISNLSVSIGGWISEKWESIKNWWNELDIKESTLNLVSSIGNWINEKWESIKNWWNESEIKELISNGFDKFTEIMNIAWEKTKKGFSLAFGVLSKPDFWKSYIKMFARNTEYIFDLLMGGIKNSVIAFLRKIPGGEKIINKLGLQEANLSQITEDYKNDIAKEQENISKIIKDEIEKADNKEKINNAKKLSTNNINSTNVINNYITNNNISQPQQTQINNTYGMSEIDDNSFGQTMIPNSRYQSLGYGI